MKNKLLIIIVLLFSVGCSNNKETSNTDNKDKQLNSMFEVSRIKDYRIKHKDFFDELQINAYNSSTSSDGVEKKDYIFKNVDEDRLDDDAYYQHIRSMYILSRQGNNDKYNDKLKEQLDEVDRELVKLNKKLKIEIRDCGYLSRDTKKTNAASNEVKNSKFKAFRIENKEYLDQLSQVVYASYYKNNKELKEYWYKGIVLDDLNDTDYYNDVLVIFQLARQGTLDRKLEETEMKKLDNIYLEITKFAKDYKLKSVWDI